MVLDFNAVIGVCRWTLMLDGKKALITGGSRGIGKAIAWELACEGCDLAIFARDAGRLADAAQEITADTGRAVHHFEVDTGDTQSVRDGVAAANAALDGVDILVNNAARPLGRAPVTGIEGMEDEQFNLDVNVKVLGYLRCAREVAPIMKSAGWGRIINISGLAARSSGAIVGSVRNVAVSALTKNLADELGPFGINVTVIHPGATRTEATAPMLAERAVSRGTTVAEEEAAMGELNSVRKVIDASDIAYVTAFLASPRSLAINGDAIAAGGGVGSAIHY